MSAALTHADSRRPPGVAGGRRLNALRVRTKLGLIALVPLAGAVVFATLFALAMRRDARAARADADQVALLVRTGDVVNAVRIDGMLIAGDGFSDVLDLDRARPMMEAASRLNIEDLRTARADLEARTAEFSQIDAATRAEVLAKLDEVEPTRAKLRARAPHSRPAKAPGCGGG